MVEISLERLYQQAFFFLFSFFLIVVHIFHNISLWHCYGNRNFSNPFPLCNLTSFFMMLIIWVPSSWWITLLSVSRTIFFSPWIGLMRGSSLKKKLLIISIFKIVICPILLLHFFSSNFINYIPSYITHHTLHFQCLVKNSNLNLTVIRNIPLLSFPIAFIIVY